MMFRSSGSYRSDFFPSFQDGVWFGDATRGEMRRCRFAREADDPVSSELAERFDEFHSEPLGEVGRERWRSRTMQLEGVVSVGVVCPGLGRTGSDIGER
jgi:hypothetical protein